MRPATRKDLPHALSIISRSFARNPSILWVIKKDRKKQQRIVALAAYSFKTALLHKGAYISSNEKGVALCYRHSNRANVFKDAWNQVVLVFTAIGIFRIGIVLKRQAYVKSQMPAGGDYFYFWFYGVMPGQNSQGDAREIKNEIFRMADVEQLPIYLETSVEKNRRVYERFGFKVYHAWDVKDQQITLYFMKREPGSHEVVHQVP